MYSALDQRSGWLLACLSSLVVVLAFRLLLPQSLQIEESTDFTTYYEPVARNLVAGQGLTLAGQPATRYPPGYPLMIAGVLVGATVTHMSEQVAFTIFSLVGMALATGMLYSIARSVWGGTLAWVAVAGWITYPFGLWLTRQSNVEVPFFLALFGACAVFWHTLHSSQPAMWHYGLAGLLTGIASLIRPIAVGVGVVFVCTLWFCKLQIPIRHRIWLGLAVLLGNLVVVLPWQVWMYSQTGELNLLSTGGLPSVRDGLVFTADSKTYRDSLSVPPDIERLMQEFRSKIAAGQMESFGQVAAFMGQALQTQPVTVLKLYAWKAARSWYATDSARYESWTLVIQLGYGGSILAATWVAWRQAGKARQLAFMVGLIVLYFWMMTIGVLSILRYMVPAIGLAFLLLPALLAWAQSRLKRDLPLTHDVSTLG
jgi:4-amino-4-deoxy-L-arabinose transferase-like glycosyltransferase